MIPCKDEKAGKATNPVLPYAGVVGLDKYPSHTVYRARGSLVLESRTPQCTRRSTIAGQPAREAGKTRSLYDASRPMAVESGGSVASNNSTFCHAIFC